MHLLIPYASALSERGTHTLQKLQLPQLTRLLARLTPTERIGTHEYALTPPHERALAQLLGWQGNDGCLPWAAYNASRDGVQVGNKAWGQLTPVHLHLGADHANLLDPQLLHLSAQESRTLFEAIRPLFESEGWTLAWGAATRWYAAHDSLDGLPSASLDRVIGRSIDRWLPETPQAKTLRRLQNEVQMMLYQQPVNDARTGLGVLPVNSFWLSGCGRAQPTKTPADLVRPFDLRAPLLSSDWAAWAAAWQTVDAGAVRDAFEAAQRGKPVAVTLCGERFAQRFETQPQGLLTQLRKRVSPESATPLLEAL